MRFATPLLGIALLCGIAGCGERPDTTKNAALKIESTAPSAQMPSGRAEAPLIDASRKSVTILAPPSAPQRIEQRRRTLAAEQDRRERRIHDLMDQYAENLGSAAAKSRYGEQLAQELDAYKQQTLELHKLQRAAGPAGGPRTGASSVE